MSELRLATAVLVASLSVVSLSAVLVFGDAPHHPSSSIDRPPPIKGNPAFDPDLATRIGQPGELLFRCMQADDGALAELYSSAADFDDGRQSFFLKRREGSGKEVLYPVHGFFLDDGASGVFMIHDGKGIKEGNAYRIDQSVNMGVLFLRTTTIAGGGPPTRKPGYPGLDPPPGPTTAEGGPVLLNPPPGPTTAEGGPVLLDPPPGPTTAEGGPPTRKAGYPGLNPPPGPTTAEGGPVLLDPPPGPTTAEGGPPTRKAGYPGLNPPPGPTSELRAIFDVFAEDTGGGSGVAGQSTVEYSCRWAEEARRLNSQGNHVRLKLNSGAMPPSHWYRESDRTLITCRTITPAHPGPAETGPFPVAPAHPGPAETGPLPAAPPGEYRIELRVAKIWPGHLGFLIVHTPGQGQPVGYNVHMLEGPGRLLIHAHSYPHRTKTGGGPPGSTSAGEGPVLLDPPPGSTLDTMDETETVIGGLLLVPTKKGYRGWIGLAGASADPYNITFSREATVGDYAAQGRIVVPPLPVTCQTVS